MEVRDATDLATAIRDGDLDPVALIDDTIDRIEAVNDKLNAVITPLYGRARSRVAEDPPTGPFGGVPFLLKDLLAPLEGAPMQFGSDFMRGYEPDHNSYLVDRYLDAGLVILGKTNTPEFGIEPTTEPDAFGSTKNPWDPTRSAGGSSGGSAAAVASGMVPMAHGNDGGGSLRIPASCCGVFGFKPTRGRITKGPDFGDLIGGLVSDHAITRSVRDSARLLDATRGPADGDPYWAPTPERPYVDEIELDPGQLDIAVVSNPPADVSLHSDCRRALDDAVELCEDLGHRVERILPELPVELVQEAYTTVWASGVAASIDGAAVESAKEPSPDDFEPMTWALYEMGTEFTASEYMMAQTYLQRISREVREEYFSEYDVWLTPTLTRPPAKLGHFDSPVDEPLKGFYRAFEYVQFTPLLNITGQPGMSVPLYWNEDGLPIGVQFAGNYGREDQLFRLAAQLENARSWVDRLPPLNVF